MFSNNNFDNKAIYVDLRKLIEACKENLLKMNLRVVFNVCTPYIT